VLHTQGNKLTWRGQATVPITTPVGQGDRSRAVGANESEVPAQKRSRKLRVSTRCSFSGSSIYELKPGDSIR